jgi:hypothetical protein
MGAAQISSLAGFQSSSTATYLVATAVHAHVCTAPCLIAGRAPATLHSHGHAALQYIVDAQPQTLSIVDPQPQTLSVVDPQPQTFSIVQPGPLLPKSSPPPAHWQDPAEGESSEAGRVRSTPTAMCRVGL